METHNTNCRLRYNTNLTSLTYKKRDIVDTWKNFSNVYIVPSIDGTGDTVEYMRTNLDWKVFETNFNRIKEELPDTMIHPGITVGVLNVVFIVSVNVVGSYFLNWQRFGINDRKHGY